MRASPLRLALPPLPPRNKLKAQFPGVAFAVVNRLRTTKGKPTDAKRLQPVDERLAREMVASFRIEKAAHVVEGFPGMGTLTRELLRYSPDHIRSLLAIEPARSFLCNGLDFPPSARTFDPAQAMGPGSTALGNPLGPADVGGGNVFDSYAFATKKTKADAEESAVHQWFVVQSLHDSRLKIADNSIYRWDSVDELIKGGYFDHVTPNKWEEDSPDLHLVAQIPGVGLGEQLVAQWISCIAQRSWLFRFGRMKMSLLVAPNLYDRLVAKPGESTYCKLSAMRSALADIAPSHPGYITAATRPVRSLRSPDAASVASAASEPAFPSVPLRAASAPADILLSPDPELYYPAYKARAAAHGAERPGMMGITLVPKKESLVHTDNKDAWEYVMRKLFVMQNQAIGMSIKNLGPGAENLLPQLIDDALPPAERLDPKKRVREFDSEDWARIVRVFMGWRFKPETLALMDDYDGRVDHKSRNMGVSL